MTINSATPAALAQPHPITQQMPQSQAEWQHFASTLNQWLKSLSQPGGAGGAAGTYLPTFQAGYAEYCGPGNVFTANTNFIFGLSIPNPSGTPAPALLLGSGVPQAWIVTDQAYTATTAGTNLGITAGETQASGAAAGGNLSLYGGACFGGTAGSAVLQGGTSKNGTGGSVTVAGGNSTTGATGDVFIIGGQTGTRGSNVHLIMTSINGVAGVLRIRVNSTILYEVNQFGAIFVGSSGAGLPGQVLISGGSSAAPVWGTINSLQTAAESLAGVVPVNLQYPPGWIPRYGAVADANIASGAGTDNAQAITNALACVGQATFVPAGNWGFSNIVVPGGQTLYGLGVHVSNLIALGGSSGTMCGDNDVSAAKTDIHDLAFYCQGNTLDPGSSNTTTYTKGFRFGYGTAHGTEGNIHDIWVRALPSGFPGIDIKGNIAKYSNLYTQTTGGLRIAGTGFSISGGCESYASQGFVNTQGVTVLTDFGDGTVDLIEIEAGATGIIPLFLTGNTAIQNIVWSPTTSSTVDHVVEIGPSATRWSFSLQSYFKAPAGVTSGGAVKWTTSGAYVGGISTAGSHIHDQNYFSGFLNALSGTAAFSANTAITVTFPQGVSASTYKVALSQSASSTLPPWWTSKTTSGFTINFSAAFTGSVDWLISI